MNTFAQIKMVYESPKVRYYSILFENKKVTEFEHFVLEHRNHSAISDEYNDLMAWIKIRLGNQKGARKEFFRHEGAADAIPPPVHWLDTVFNENLRLL